MIVRSIWAEFAATLLRLRKNILEGQLREGIHELRCDGEKPYQLPEPVKLSGRVETGLFRDMQLFTVNQKASSRRTVIYLHGGSYVEEFILPHWQFMLDMAFRTDSRILAPDYPLAPFSDWRRSYDLLTALYVEYRRAYPDRRIILMGDSAGGGLALGLCQSFARNGIPQPDELILLSPWVDVSMTAPDLDEYDQQDPLLVPELLKACGECWAGGTDLKDPHVSPLYGSVEGLQNVTVFAGTAEVLYPDILRFCEKAKETPGFRKIIAEGMYHVYPLYPIPEAAEAVKKIREIILDDEKEKSPET